MTTFYSNSIDGDVQDLWMVLSQNVSTSWPGGILWLATVELGGSLRSRSDWYMPPGRLGPLTGDLLPGPVTSNSILKRCGASIFPKQINNGLLTAATGRCFSATSCVRSLQRDTDSIISSSPGTLFRLDMEYDRYYLRQLFFARALCITIHLSLSIEKGDQRTPKVDGREFSLWNRIAWLLKVFMMKRLDVVSVGTDQKRTDEAPQIPNLVSNIATTRLSQTVSDLRQCVICGQNQCIPSSAWYRVTGRIWSCSISVEWFSMMLSLTSLQR